MNSPHITRIARLGVLAAGTISSLAVAQAEPRVQVNGQILQTNVAPIQSNGRTLVPMRAIFQALGAPVTYNKLTREVSAQTGSATVRLQIGRREALVNNQRVTLDQAPILSRGATLVPLRFVAEGLGADVHWNNALQLVSVSTKGTAGQPGRGATGSRTIVIPADSVVPVRLNEILSSGDARVGDIFTARVTSEREGDSEFPPGSTLEGVVTGVQRRIGGAQGTPGILDIEFRAVVLPDGARFPIRGQIIPLGDNALRTNAQGRITARPAATRGGKFSIVGVGNGYELGHLERRGGRLVGITNIAGRDIFRRARNNARIENATVPRGVSMGVRMVSGISYTDTTNYAFTRGRFLNGQSGAQ